MMNFKKIFIELTKNILIKNVYRTKYKKRCIFIFATRPFVSKKIKHANYYEALTIAKAISSHGYNVDVLFYDSSKKIDYKKYDLVIGLGEEYTKSYGKCRPDTRRIYYATGACFVQANTEEIMRWTNLYKRRGDFKAVDRFEKITKPGDTTLSLSSSDAIIGVGGSWPESTFKFLNVPYYYVGAVPLTKYKIQDFSRDLIVARNNFLCLVGNGYVHKGVDLLIETFAKLPHCNLFIAGNYDNGFFSIYEKELNLPNIQYLGFLNTSSESFFSICNKCCFIIDASCSEGTCTSVLTGMKTGLIPIISEREGINFKSKIGQISDFSIDKIIELIKSLKKFDDAFLKNEAERTAKFVEENYSLEHYRLLVENALDNILDN